MRDNLQKQGGEILVYKMETMFSSEELTVKQGDIKRLNKILSAMGFKAFFEQGGDFLLLKINDLEVTKSFNKKTFDMDEVSGKIKVLETRNSRYTDLFRKIRNRINLPVAITSTSGFGSKATTYKLSIYGRDEFFKT